MEIKRRNFIKTTGLLSAGTLLVPQFLQGKTKGMKKNGKKLVVIQFSGGNDGLNAIIPYENDIYYRLRPDLGIPKSNVLKANDALGFNPSLNCLQELYGNGELSIVNSVGYPNPDRSHFRSMDIWHTASDSNEYLSDGWLGRYMDAFPEGNPWKAIEIDDSLCLAMKGKKKKGLAITNPQRLYLTTQDEQIREIAKQHKDEHQNLGYLYKTLRETVESAEYVQKTSRIYQSQVTYPNTELGRELKLVGQLINSGIETDVFYVSFGGFDTHINQITRQKQLFTQYSEAISAFSKDLKTGNNWNNTLVMTFSEFGRRVSQNGSQGTDHGTANNLYLMGGGIKNPGFYNEGPDLNDLDNGDLKFKIDFRQVYSTVLDKWMEVESRQILGEKFNPLDIL